MNLDDKLLASLPEGEVRQVCIGLHWTAVVAEVGGEQRCGLASTLRDEVHDHHRRPDVPQAGELAELPGRELAALLRSDRSTLVSVGMAAVNALLPRRPETWVDMNAEELIAGHGAGKTVALVGHFPFVPRLRSRVGELIVLENRPQPGDLPASAAQQVIPGADVVAITGMTLLNHTLEGILQLCSPQALVIVLGPSTPLTPVLWDYGVDWLSGAVVENVEAVLRAVSQGGNFRQVHRAGVRLVNMHREGIL